MNKPNWGLKRQCHKCGAFFYDMGKKKELFHRNSELTGTKIEKQFIQIFIFLKT